MKKYKFKAKELKTGRWVYGDLVYAQRMHESEGERPMIVHTCIHGGMIWVSFKAFVDESTITAYEQEREDGLD